METQESVIREKFHSIYSEVFEEELIDEIMKVSYFDKIKNGNLLIDIGDDMFYIPLLIEGVVKIIRQDKYGEEIVLYFLEPGESCAISFANCINKRKSIFKGIIEKDIEAVFLPVESIDDWLVKFKSWRHFIIDSYHFRLLEMVESIDSLAFLKMSERVLKNLTDKVKINNSIDLDITHQDIANDLNTSRVVITRILKQLHDEEKIYSTRNKIRVLKQFK
ncbi:Crp/Fnr family transcriptional regulator [Flaviramulus sp. BrNp1-15]|uniref:Crp/Fnr family transcriptional regulator n=1 Tax=Flaviramulus sp. BrNp1-15 TaxID=2916754 RepID=UPI001EE82353|nr:Crp/Fnr family transcriptional regulator [Flaviramulus sp. BrNp1-15]ULC58492.1 Crp/Fnr family transcriptional regulator [Flaviramulus sp. BrNp1-15]